MVERERRKGAAEMRGRRRGGGIVDVRRRRREARSRGRSYAVGLPSCRVRGMQASQHPESLHWLANVSCAGAAAAVRVCWRWVKR